jgi:hypothetical protein
MTRALYCVIRVVCVAAFFAATLSAAMAESKRVLLISSYGRQFAPWNDYTGEIRAELQDEWKGPLDIYELALMPALFGQGERDFANYVHTLFSDRRPDIILTIGAPAVNFVQRFRQSLFPATAVLQTTADPQLLQSLNANDAAVSVNFDLAGSIKNILRVLPDTTNIAVVMGNSPHEKEVIERRRRAFQPFTDRVTFTWLNELSLNEIMRRAARLPPHSAIFWLRRACHIKGLMR